MGPHIARYRHCGTLAVPVVIAFFAAVTTAQAQQDGHAARDDSTARRPADQVGPSGANGATGIEQDTGYYDEPPLDFYERRWRWFSRHTRPQRFSRRDLRRRYGYDPPFVPGAFSPGFRRYGWGYSPWYGAGAAGGVFEGQAYIQGRHDERRFEQWRTGYEKGRKVYSEAMSTGVRLFREAEYAAALRDFILAAKQNQGDPASRVHATYALVALGNYDDAVLMIRRAIQLQSRLPYLSMNIEAEYGPKVDFEAHRRALRRAAEETAEDPGLWMLIGFYDHFSTDGPPAAKSLERAARLAPRDPIIRDLYEAARLTTPSRKRR